MAMSDGGYGHSGPRDELGPRRCRKRRSRPPGPSSSARGTAGAGSGSSESWRARRGPSPPAWTGSARRRRDVVLTLVGNRPEWVARMVACFRQGFVVLPCTEQLRPKDLQLRLAVAHAQRYLTGQRLQAEHWLDARDGELVWCATARRLSAGACRPGAVALRTRLPPRRQAPGGVSSKRSHRRAIRHHPLGGRWRRCERGADRAKRRSFGRARPRWRRDSGSLPSLPSPQSTASAPRRAATGARRGARRRCAPSPSARPLRTRSAGRAGAPTSA
jgi:hypothetical protein